MPTLVTPRGSAQSLKRQSAMAASSAGARPPLLPAPLSLAAVLFLCAVRATTGIAAGRSDATPVQRVVQLLTRLENQIAEEGSKEAAEYDKFACFCKKEADDHRYEIEKSEALIKELDAIIEKLTPEISMLSTEITDLGTTITDLGNNVSALQNDRDTQHANYTQMATDLADAIEGIGEAIHELKASKGQMERAKLNLAQLAEVVTALPAAVGASPARAMLVEASRGSSKQPSAKAPVHAYKYQSNDIIEILLELRKDLKAQKADLDKEEKEAQSAHDLKKQAMLTEKDFAEKEKIEKEALHAKKVQEEADAQGQKTAETTAKTADEGYLVDLTTQCQDKATEWDQRSKTRSEELTAISEAKGILSKGVVDNYSANKLVVLEKGRKMAKGNDRARAPSFLQLRGADAADAATTRRLLDLVDGAAKRLHSPRLSGLTVKVRVKLAGGSDHFADVKQLIQDLITKLQGEATTEEQSKTYCDNEMTKATSDRDQATIDVEAAQTTIQAMEARKAAQQKEIAEGSEEIAAAKKAIMEVEQLRAEEKAMNEKTIADAQAGKAAVDEAILILQNFYSAQFLQKGAAKGGQGPDRNGTTVADEAPELSYTGQTYKGKQEASQGILGILQMISDDFDRTISGVQTEDSNSDTAATNEINRLEGEILAKEGELSGLEGAVTGADVTILRVKDRLKTASALHSDSLATLEELKVMCMAGEGSFADRQKNREAEIAALQEALSILENWKAL